MGCHVRHRCCLACGSGCSNGWRVGDVTRGRVGSGGERAHWAYPQLAAGEGTSAGEGFAGTRVSRGLALEQGQRLLGALRGPDGQHTSIVHTRSA